jgi:hypothetical protein
VGVCGGVGEGVRGVCGGIEVIFFQIDKLQ